MIGPIWSPPRAYGSPAATDSASTIAAPLLAGFSITLSAQVIASNAAVRWPDVVFILLAGATVSLLAAVQCGFWARQYSVTPGELESWWPDLAQPARWANVRQDQWAHAWVCEIWSRRFRFAYTVGVLLLLAGLGFALVPGKTGGELGWPRLIAIGVVATGLVGELIWIAASRMQRVSSRLKLARDRREAEKRRDELAGRVGDVEAALAAARLSRRLAHVPEPEVESDAKEERRRNTEELPWGVRAVMRAALRVADAIVPPIPIMKLPNDVAPPQVLREARVDEPAPPPLPRPRLGPRQVKVLALVTQRTAVTSEVVASETGYRPSDADKILTRLVELGAVRRSEVNGSVTYEAA